jgi:hypothetical protein
MLDVRFEKGNDWIWVGSLPKVALFFESGMTKRRREFAATQTCICRSGVKKKN